MALCLPVCLRCSWAQHLFRDAALEVSVSGLHREQNMKSTHALLSKLFLVWCAHINRSPDVLTAPPRPVQPDDCCCTSCGGCGLPLTAWLLWTWYGHHVPLYWHEPAMARGAWKSSANAWIGDVRCARCVVWVADGASSLGHPCLEAGAAKGQLDTRLKGVESVPSTCAGGLQSALQSCTGQHVD